MPEELQNLLRMLPEFQTTAPVSTDVSMFDEGEQFDIREKQKLWESIKDFKATEPKGMKLERIIKEKYKTGREYLAHEAIDTEIGRDNLLSMSQMPERQLVGGVGTGLDALAGFSKAASLIPSIASKKYGYILNPLIELDPPIPEEFSPLAVMFPKLALLPCEAIVICSCVDVFAPGLAPPVLS